MPTFTDVLASLLRSDPGRPLVTFYDIGTGERTELSVATYANWVAKGAGLLATECGLERGQRVLVDLPTHWLGPVVLGASWTVGLEVVLPGSGQLDPADLADQADQVDGIVCGPGGLDRYAARAARMPVLASALRPLGARFSEPLPADVVDIGVEIWSQPDAFVPWDPAGPEDPAVDGRTHAELWAGTGSGSAQGAVRLLTEENPASPTGLSSFTEPLRRGGSVVLVVGARPEDLGAIAASERADAPT